MVSNVIKYHTSTGHKKWIWWLVASITVFVLLLVLYTRLHRRGQTITKLRTQAETALKKAQQLRYAAARESKQEYLQELLAQAEVLEQRARDKDEEMQRNEKLFTDEFKKIRALESWKDLDTYNAKSRS